MTTSDTYGINALKVELTLDEGREKIPYFDTRHLLTGGIGRNLGKGFSDAEIDLMFANDVAECCTIMDHNIPWWRTLPPGKQRVMINLCFMGWGSFSQFVKFFAAMQAADWHTAAYEIHNSRWYLQVGDRGPRVIERLLASDDRGTINAV